MKTITAVLAFASVLLVASGATAQSAEPRRAFITIDAGEQATTTSFSEPFAATQYLENESVNPTYRVGSGLMFGVGGGVKILPHVAVGVTVSSFQRTGGASIAAAIPHPFFYGTMRSIAGDASGVDRRETAAHIQATVFVPVGRRLYLALSGGPSYFSVRQDMVTGISFDETYPYDTASFRTATVAGRTKSAWGFNLGGDATIRVAKVVGLGGGVRYAHGRVDLAVANTTGNVHADAGGVQLSAGVRLLF